MLNAFPTPFAYYANTVNSQVGSNNPPLAFASQLTHNNRMARPSLSVLSALSAHARTPGFASPTHPLLKSHGRLGATRLAAMKQEGSDETPQIPKVGVEQPQRPGYRVPAPDLRSDSRFNSIKEGLTQSGLHTVCEEAQCRNIGECWSGEHATATIMILGDTCTRGCHFCAVDTNAKPAAPDPDEPFNVAMQVSSWGVDYIVITSVDRDDLKDGGAEHFTKTVQAVKSLKPSLLVECLAGDFRGDRKAVEQLANSGLDVYAHNIETVERLQANVRDRRATYQQSLTALQWAKAANPDLLTKSSIMVGLGETRDEIKQALQDLRDHGVEAVTLGQYLRPEERHLSVVKYYTEEEFAEMKTEAEAMGFKYVASGPLVRSSYKAGEYYLASLLKA